MLKYVLLCLSFICAGNTFAEDVCLRWLGSLGPQIPFVSQTTQIKQLWRQSEFKQTLFRDDPAEFRRGATKFLGRWKLVAVVPNSPADQPEARADFNIPHLLLLPNEMSFRLAGRKGEKFSLVARIKDMRGSKAGAPIVTSYTMNSASADRVSLSDIYFDIVFTNGPTLSDGRPLSLRLVARPFIKDGHRFVVVQYGVQGAQAGTPPEAYLIYGRPRG